MTMPSKTASRPAKSHRSTLSLQKTEVVIHVYDLLPPGRLASSLWFVGLSLLHSGVVINGREYAYGGHDRPGVTGVYWTKPRSEPPGGTFKCEILHGFTFAPLAEIDSIIREASDDFQGSAYNILTRNCNHFTSHLCQKLTGHPAPGWLNRAASVGVALPCVVPREWIEPPDYNAADGELLDDEEDFVDERSRMLRQPAEPPHMDREGDGQGASEWNSEDERRQGRSGKGKGRAPILDSSGRRLPPAEIAPSPA